MIEDIENALSFIPANDRDVCVKVGMAIKSEEGESGFNAWDNWLQESESYNSKDMRSVWKSINPAGGIGVGSLFHMAKENGYKPNKDAPKLSPQEIEMRKAEQRARQIDAEEKQKQEHEKAATECSDIWNKSKPAPDNQSYLKYKQVGSHGVNIDDDNNLLISIRKNKVITSIQTIYSNGDKKFYPGGAISGGYHVIGKPGSNPILVGEGYATLASAFEATGYCSVVAFNTGNLKIVAETIRGLFPDNKIIVLADDDQWTEGNPGITKATEAAQLINGCVISPKFKNISTNPTDFNDLHCAEGLEVVKQQIESSIEVKLKSAEPELKTEPIEQEEVKESPETVIQQLSNLSPLEYEAARKDKAKELGFRPNVLDKAVEDARPEIEGDNSMGGREVVFNDCDMFDGKVVGCDVLDETLNHITRHMHINLHDAVISVLWSAHTHIYSKFNHTPRLIISAPEPECGKTVLLFHMVGNFSNKVLPTDNLSPAVFFRLAEKYEPTFLIDEGDVFINQDSDLIAGFNNGFEPHGGVYRCVGDDHEVRKFPTFAPLALAGIQLEKKLPPATRSRAFIIHLERVGDEINDNDSWDKDIHKSGLLNTRKKIARWVHDNSITIASLKPQLPKGLKNRSKDKWTPLFSIAQVAGGKWPAKVLDAYNKSIHAHEPTKSEQFLIDVESVTPGTGNIHTHILIAKLCDMEDSKYKEYNFKAFEHEKKKIQPIQIANIFKKYSIKSKGIKIAGSVKKGYYGDELRKTFKRYIPKKPQGYEEKNNTSLEPTSLAVTPLPSSDSNGYSDILPVTPTLEVTDKNSLKAKPSNEGNGVTPKHPISVDNIKKEYRF